MAYVHERFEKRNATLEIRDMALQLSDFVRIGSLDAKGRLALPFKLARRPMAAARALLFAPCQSTSDRFFPSPEI